MIVLRRFSGVCLLLGILCGSQALALGTRVKDLVMLAGARDNQLVGYGIVVG
jgi:flagellar basal body P-ring protein FlgI